MGVKGGVLELRAVAMVLALLIGLSVPLRAQPLPDDWRIDRLEWSTESGEGQKIVVVNPYGDVRARAGKNEEVYVLALGQRHEGDPRRVEINSRVGQDGSLHVVVAYTEAIIPEAMPSVWEKSRVDVTVYLPARVSVAIETPGGDVQVKGVNGELSITTGNGDVMARGRGPMVIRSEHGAILAQLLSVDGKGTSRLQTVSGTIRVELPRGHQLATLVETRGEITTDYSLEIERTDGSRLKRASTVPVGGPRRLELRSYQGDIQLIESAVLANSDKEPLE